MTDFPTGKIQAQLERILASPDFVAGRKLCQFLSYVVGETLGGNRDRITQYSIAIEALGYSESFDPTTVPNIRVLARRLRRALEQYYINYGAMDPIRIDVPKGGYVPTFLKNPPTPQGPGSPEHYSPAAEQIPADSGKPSIAVVMFDCLNAKETFGYVSTGLTEEIIISLTRFPEFMVIGPLQKEIIHQQNMDTRSMGRRYGVGFVLDGTIRVEGDMIRLTIRLADTESGQHLWGQSLDCKLKNGSIMGMENDVVNQVAAIIADSYGIIPRTLTKKLLTQRTGNTDVYNAILYYYHYFRMLTQEAYVDAMNALESTVQHNPNHALATAALGDLVATTYLFGYDEDESNLARAEMLTRKSVALDPDCQVGRFAMAFIHFLKFQRSLFLDEVEYALRLNPNNAHFIAVISLHMAMVGEWERAMELIRQAMRLNPHHPGWYHILAFMNYYRQGEYDLALIEAQRFNSPEFFWDPLIRSAVLGQLNRTAEASSAVDELLVLVPDFKHRGPDLIRRLAYLDEHVDMLVEGLRKAGLEMQSEG